MPPSGPTMLAICLVAACGAPAGAAADRAQGYRGVEIGMAAVAAVDVLATRHMLCARVQGDGAPEQYSCETPGKETIVMMETSGAGGVLTALRAEETAGDSDSARQRWLALIKEEGLHAIEPMGAEGWGLFDDRRGIVYRFEDHRLFMSADPGAIDRSLDR